jgi:hypothetical protein
MMIGDEMCNYWLRRLRKCFLALTLRRWGGMVSDIETF